jgi:hypothetical protein
MRHLMEESIPELTLRALTHEVDIQGEFDHDPLTRCRLMITDMTEPPSHPIAESEVQIGGQPAPAVGSVEIPVERDQELLLGGCAAAAAGSRWGSESGRAIAGGGSGADLGGSDLGSTSGLIGRPAPKPSNRADRFCGATVGTQEGGDCVHHIARRSAECGVQV